ncbi:hypothetical protein MMC25_007431 [Agyrium rufum]|nr:hypothetical protein [Agyrium rufum]
MIVRHTTSAVHSLPSFLIPSLQRATTITTSQHRTLHSRSAEAPVPPPLPFVPDPQTFLTLIGRKLSQHSSKFETWEQLFRLSSQQLRDLGVEPPRNRRYLLWWRDKYRRGEYGIGGDLVHVKDGVGELRVVEKEDPKQTKSTDVSGKTSLLPGMRKIIVNTPLSESVEEGEAGEGKTSQKIAAEEAEESWKRVRGFGIRGAHTIIGPYVEPVKGTDGRVARLRVKEGMWEERRGHKVDGGERRKEFNRAMRRLKEKGTLK